MIDITGFSRLLRKNVSPKAFSVISINHWLIWVSLSLIFYNIDKLKYRRSLVYHVFVTPSLEFIIYIIVQKSDEAISVGGGGGIELETTSLGGRFRLIRLYAY